MPLFERVLQRVAVGRGTSLLDLGCGAGVLCRIAADRGAQVTGIDRDAGQLEQAAALVPEGAFDMGDMLALPYPAGSFDVAVCVQSLMHVTNPLTALREAVRVVRPGALVVVTIWGKEESCGRVAGRPPRLRARATGAERRELRHRAPSRAGGAGRLPDIGWRRLPAGQHLSLSRRELAPDFAVTYSNLDFRRRVLR